MRRLIQFSFLFFLIFLFVFGCKKPEDIGLGVLPGSDLLNATFTDSFTVQSRTLKEDSLRADELSGMLLGSYVDSAFGLSEASIYSQVLLSTITNLKSDTSNSLQADSVVLALAYSGFYGDTLTPQVVHVYPITQDLHYDSTYYTNQTFTDSSVDLANSYSFIPRPNDSVQVDTVKQRAQLRIKLDPSFANTLIALNGQSAFASNDNWLAYFKGIHVKVDPASGLGNGAILYFNPFSAYTKMTLYYREIDTSSVVTRRTFDFYLIGGARVNHLSHDYSTYPVGNQINDSSVDSTVNYIQSMAGTKLRINLPSIKHLKDSGNVIINKAELVITVVGGTTTKYAAPSDLFLSAYDSTGKINFISDYFEGNFGGGLNVSNNTYKFNISRHVQSIIDDKIGNYGFSLNTIGGAVQANRVIVGSNKSTAYKMKLNLFYTRLK